jgi:recombination protein RecA
MYGEGISREGSILDIGAELDIVLKSGAWYSYEGERLGQGRENSKQFLKENEATAAAIERKIRDHYKLDDIQAEPDEPEEEPDAQHESGLLAEEEETADTNR